MLYRICTARNPGPLVWPPIQMSVEAEPRVPLVLRLISLTAAIRGARWPLALALWFVCLTAHAQTDEIQVYDGSLAEPGKWNLTLHNNYILDGRKTPAFPGGLVPDQSWNGVPEWALGVTEWFEAGLYLPVYSVSRGRGLTLDSGKVRTLFASPHADQRSFFYGVNFELSYNARFWEPARISSEVRPILGLRLGSFDFILNPILDTDFNGLGHLDFAPASRVAWNLSHQWALAVEEYDDFGVVRHFQPGHEQFHEVFGVVDFRCKLVNIEFGAGFGLSHGSDTVTLKLILSRDLN